MFPDLLQQEGSVLRKKFLVNWHLIDGTRVINSASEVIYYHSKSEFRLSNVPRKNTEKILQIDHLLLFRRDGAEINITHFGPNYQHFFRQLGQQSLVDKLPKRSKKPDNSEKS